MRRSRRLCALLAALMTLKIPTAILKDDTAVFDYGTRCALR